jgi:hypothetical protein
MDEPDWQSRLSPIEEIFFATSPSATHERWRSA